MQISPPRLVTSVLGPNDEIIVPSLPAFLNDDTVDQDLEDCGRAAVQLPGTDEFIHVEERAIVWPGFDNGHRIALKVADPKEAESLQAWYWGTR